MRKTMKKAGVKKKNPTKMAGGTMKKAGVMKKRPAGLRAGSMVKKKK